MTDKLQTVTIDEMKNLPGNIEVIESTDRFQYLLKLHQITDLSDRNKIQIQKDTDRYVVSLFGNGEKKEIAISGHNFQQYIKDFLDSQQQSDEQVAVELSGLQLSIMRGTSEEISKHNEETEQHEQDATDPVFIRNKINTLKDFFESQKDEAKRERFWLTADYANSPQERQFRKQHRSQIKNRLNDLEKIEKKLEEIQDPEYLANNPNFNEYIVKDEYKNLSKQLDILSANVPQFTLQGQSLRNGNADLTPYYDMKFINRAQAKRILRSIEKYNKKQVKLDQTLSDVDKEQMRGKDLDAFEDYLTKVVNGTIDPATTPFNQKYKDAFIALIKTDEELKNDFPMIKTDDYIEQKMNQNQNTTTTPNTQNNTTNNNPNTNQETVTAPYGSAEESLRKGGVGGMLDYYTKGIQDTTPRGQAFYKSFGNIALLAGGVFLGWKAIKSTWNILRGKGTGKDWGRAGGAAGLLLLTAGKPQDIFKGGYPSEKIADLLKRVGIFGADKGKTETDPQAITGAMALFNGKNYEQLKGMLKDENGKMKLKPESYDQMINEANLILNNPASTDIQKTSANIQKQFLESIGKNDKHGLIDYMLTSMGISWATINDPKESKTLFNKIAQQNLERLAALNTKLGTSYENTNSELDQDIKNYIATGNPTLDELEAKGAFEKNLTSLSDAEKSKLDTMISTLGITDPTNIKKGLYQFYLDRPTTSGDEKTKLNIKKEGDKIIFETYGNPTEINLDSKTIPGLTTSFSSYKELFKVANMTNRIKDITKKQEAVGKEPFSISPRNNLNFNNTEWHEVRKFDTTIAKEDTLKKISPNLANQKEQYAKYLNYRWENKNNSTYTPTETPIITPVVAAVAGSNISNNETNNNTSNNVNNNNTNSTINEANNNANNNIETSKPTNILEQAFLAPELADFDNESVAALNNSWNVGYGALVNDNSPLIGDSNLSTIFDEVSTKIIKDPKTGEQYIYSDKFTDPSKQLPFIAKVKENKIVATGHLNKDKTKNTIDFIEDKNNPFPFELKDETETLFMANFINYLKAGFRGKASVSDKAPFNRGENGNIVDMLGGTATALTREPDLEFDKEGSSIDKEVINRDDYKDRLPSLKDPNNRQKFIAYLNNLKIWN